MTLHSGFGTPETSREHLLSEMIIHIGYVPGIFFYAKVFETTRYIYLIYRTRAIIGRSSLEAALKYKPYIRPKVIVHKWSLEMG